VLTLPGKHRRGGELAPDGASERGGRGPPGWSAALPLLPGDRI